MTDHLRAVIVAGHSGDTATARAALSDELAAVRAAALGALDRCNALTDDDLVEALGDPATEVRRRAVEIAADRPGVSLLALLEDADPDVVEVAAWACGEQLEGREIQEREHDPAYDHTMQRLAELAVDADEPLVREAAAAALGAIGDPVGLPAILHACGDKPHVRRRAVLALAPFDGPDVDAEIERALVDRDWQVRQAAEDIRRAQGELTT